MKAPFFWRSSQARQLSESLPHEWLENPTRSDRGNVAAFFPPYNVCMDIRSQAHREVERVNPVGLYAVARSTVASDASDEGRAKGV